MDSAITGIEMCARYAAILIGLGFALRVTKLAVTTRRLGIAPERVQAMVTVRIIGFGLIVGTAIGVCTVTVALLNHYIQISSLSVAVGAQVLAGFAASWAAAKLFHAVLSQRLESWLSGAEDPAHG